MWLHGLHEMVLLPAFDDSSGKRFVQGLCDELGDPVHFLHIVSVLDFRKTGHYNRTSFSLDCYERATKHHSIWIWILGPILPNLGALLRRLVYISESSHTTMYLLADF